MATARQRRVKAVRRSYWNRKYRFCDTVRPVQQSPRRLHLESLGRKDLLVLAKDAKIRGRHGMTSAKLVDALMAVDLSEI